MSKSLLSSIIFKIQTVLWFALAIGLLMVWLFLWATTDRVQAREQHQKEKISLNDAPLPTYIESYVQLTKEVPPIDFSTVVRDLRNYPSEFKDKKHFEKYAKKWTVQVMNVSNNDIIAEYLNQREDRNKFAYFRYHNANGELRYILTYDTMNSAQEALITIKNGNFGLPSSVKLKAEEISYYIKIMDQYERGDNIFPANDDEELKQLILTPAKAVVPPAPLGQGQLKANVDNKFYNAAPATPNAPSPFNSVGASSTVGADTSASATSNTATSNNKAKPSPAPQDVPESQKVEFDMAVPVAPVAPVAPPPKLVSPEPPPAPPPVQDEVYYGRPNTNTNSIPGADRD